MTPIQSANLAVRFALELCALAALAYWGWHVSDVLVVRLLTALAAAAVGALVWGIWVAPKSKRRLPDPWRLIPEALVFGSAALAMVAVGNPLLGAALAALAILNRVLLEVLGTCGA
jgi:hypothetical protein